MAADGLRRAKWHKTCAMLAMPKQLSLQLCGHLRLLHISSSSLQRGHRPVCSSLCIAASEHEPTSQMDSYSESLQELLQDHGRFTKTQRPFSPVGDEDLHLKHDCPLVMSLYIPSVWTARLWKPPRHIASSDATDGSDAPP